jgi:hypothetical protein
VSGSRHFDDDDDQGASSASEDSDSDSSDDRDSDAEGRSVVRGLAGVRRLRKPPQPSVRDASISVWDFGEPGET